MAKFDLFYPCRPIMVNQIFGNPDPRYFQFGLKGHNGMDLFATTGQPVYACHDGIAYQGTDTYEGHGIVLRTLTSFDYNGGEQVYFKSIYWHLLPDGMVKDGSQVKAGDLLGYADNTGFSTGDHLHFGLKPQAPKDEDNKSYWNIEQNNGYAGAIDPNPYFNGYYAVDAQKVLGNLQTQISLLSKVVELLRKLLLK